MGTHSAPGKLILCGEHAVVYGRPAIALPVHDIRVRVKASPADAGSGMQFDAPDLGRSWFVGEAPDDPLSQLAVSVLTQLHAATPDVLLQIVSDIPIASGMGSGAAIATAVVRALAEFLGRTFEPAAISALVYESEKRYHGTPSGIDNTVVAFEQPIWFMRGEGRTQNPEPTITPITIAAPFTLLVGDTGVRSATKLPVSAVRRRWEADPKRYEDLFDQVGACVSRIRDSLTQGEIASIGSILTENQHLLAEIGVSSPELDRLVHAALSAGAWGAKLSGAGWGGVMIAMVAPEDTVPVHQALLAAGAVRVLETRVGEG